MNELLIMHKQAGELMQKAEALPMIRKPPVLSQLGRLQHSINGRLIVELQQANHKIAAMGGA